MSGSAFDQVQVHHEVYPLPQVSEEDATGAPVIRGKGAGNRGSPYLVQVKPLCPHPAYLQSLRGQGGGVEGVEQRVDRVQKSQKVSFPSLVRTL